MTQTFVIPKNCPVCGARFTYYDGQAANLWCIMGCSRDRRGLYKVQSVQCPNCKSQVPVEESQEEVVVEERIYKLESQVKAILDYIQWFGEPIAGEDCMDIHFGDHQRVAGHETAITNQALEITMLKAQVESLRQTVIKLHSDSPVHPLIE